MLLIALLPDRILEGHWSGYISLFILYWSTPRDRSYWRTPASFQSPSTDAQPSAFLNVSHFFFFFFAQKMQALGVSLVFKVHFCSCILYIHVSLAVGYLLICFWNMMYLNEHWFVLLISTFDSENQKQKNHVKKRMVNIDCVVCHRVVSLPLISNNMRLVFPLCQTRGLVQKNKKRCQIRSVKSLIYITERAFVVLKFDHIFKPFAFPLTTCYTIRWKLLMQCKIIPRFMQWNLISRVDQCIQCCVFDGLFVPITHIPPALTVTLQPSCLFYYYYFEWEKNVIWIIELSIVFK